ncbi:MAG TPA: energy transducer TonB [Candidatus Acidoferrales bacterium]|nr:energy transducer TonB [Candidatus Acidoferrales bacterium]
MGTVGAILIASLVFLTMTTAGRASDKSSKDAAARPQALALFQKALAVSNIRAPGSPPFELRGTILVHGVGKEDASGTYLLKWATPDRWREEIHFPNYFRIRVGGKDEYFQSRSIPYEVVPVYDLSAALDFLKELHFWAKESSIADRQKIKTHQRKVGRVKADCVTLLRKKDDAYGPEFCFDLDKGLLLRSENNEFSGFASVGGKLFPSVVLVKGASPTTVELKLSTLASLESVTDADFQPAPDATTWASCDDPDQLALLSHSAIPNYPVGARLAHVQGIVVAYGIVGADGRLHGLKTLNNPNSDLTQSALTVLNQWEYGPEFCHGKPVSTEVVIRVVFNIGD